MEKVKYMLYKLMSRTLSLEEFKAWLYHDTYVKNHILNNELIFELVSTDLSSKNALYELEKFCFAHFSKDECVLEVVRFNCLMLLERSRNQDLDDFINNIVHFYNWETDYLLLSQINWLGDEWHMAQQGLYSQHEVQKDILEFAEACMKKLSEGCDKKMLMERMKLSGPEYRYPKTQVNTKSQ